MKSYFYIEVFENGQIVLMFYTGTYDRPHYEDKFNSWSEVIEAGVFDTWTPVHISPDLFSDAGQENTEWQAANNIYNKER